MTLAKALDADQRADALQRLGEGELDVLVVGGGIVGVGAALDAVTRGLRVGLDTDDEEALVTVIGAPRL